MTGVRRQPAADQADRVNRTDRANRLSGIGSGSLWWESARDWFRQPGRLRRLRGEIAIAADGVSYSRLHFLAVAGEIGLLQTIGTRAVTCAELATRLCLPDEELLTAFLTMGAAHRELRRRADGTWVLRGRRAKALALPGGEGLLGRLEETLHLDGSIYPHLPTHLRGAPAGPYLETVGGAVASGSAAVEPCLTPLVRAAVTKHKVHRLLDVGCGNAMFSIRAARAQPTLTSVGVEIDPGVADLASADIADAGLGDRIRIVTGDIRDAAVGEDFDLILFLQSVYYFPEAELITLFSRFRSLLAPGGSVLTAFLCSGDNVMTAHYDVLFRVTDGLSPLPTRETLERQLRQAGLSVGSWIQLAPGQPFYAVLATRTTSDVTDNERIGHR